MKCVEFIFLATVSSPLIVRVNLFKFLPRINTTFPALPSNSCQAAARKYDEKAVELGRPMNFPTEPGQASQLRSLVKYVQI